MLSTLLGEPLKIERSFEKDIGDGKKGVRHLWDIRGGCPFLKDNSCSIHDQRPCQCRLYHCGRLTKDDTKADVLLGYVPGQKSVQIMVDENQDYKDYKRTIEEDGVAWGNAHGWNWRKAKSPFSVVDAKIDHMEEEMKNGD